MKKLPVVLFLCLGAAGCSSVTSKLVGVATTSASKVYSADDLLTASQATSIRKHYFHPDCAATSSRQDRKSCEAKYDIADPELADTTWLNGKFTQKFDAATDAQKKALRNDMIEDLIVLSNHDFHQYILLLYASKASVDTWFDLSTTALSGTAALATGGATPRILSGIASFLGGARTSIDKNTFADQSIQSIINTMDSNRLTKQVAILKHKDESLDTYSLHQAASDLIDMHGEGNIVKALNSLVQTTGTAQVNAKLDLADLKQAH